MESEEKQGGRDKKGERRQKLKHGEEERRTKFKKRWQEGQKSRD